jgi:hypothetical protein
MVVMVRFTSNAPASATAPMQLIALSLKLHNDSNDRTVNCERHVVASE